jgi:hypothetical protein
MLFHRRHIRAPQQRAKPPPRSLPSLERLVQQRRFDDIIEILQVTDVRDDTATLSAWLGGKTPAAAAAATSSATVGPTMEWSGDALEATLSSALHLIVSAAPPSIHVVQAFLEKWRELSRGSSLPEATVDACGRTVLHQAVAAGCHVAIVHCLTAASELAVFACDNGGRLPLHNAVVVVTTAVAKTGRMSSTRHCLAMVTGVGGAAAAWRRVAATCQDNAVAVVQYLLRIYPAAAFMADANGQTPLDLALQCGADNRIVASLIMVQHVLRCHHHHDDGGGGVAKPEPDAVATAMASTWDMNWPVWVLPKVYGGNDMADEVSSVGSRGVSRHRRLVTI